MYRKYLASLCLSAAVLGAPASLPASSVHASSVNASTLRSIATFQQTSSIKQEEEIEVTGDQLLAKLRTRLKEGFTAYMNGDFALAEVKFTSALKEARNDELLDTQNLKIFGDDILGANRPIFSYMTLTDRQRLSAVYYMRGISQARQGKTDSAKVSIRKAIKINPKNFDARVDYALLELQSGKLRKAEKQIKRLRKLMKKCKDESVGHCDDLGNRFADLQIVYANTSVN